MSPRTVSIVLCTALALSGLALAQSSPPPLGSISGVVLDVTSQRPLAEAAVLLRGATLPGEQTVVTEADGSFEITLLQPGAYTLGVRSEGFEPFSAELPVRDRRVRVRLSLLPVKPVQAAAPAIETAVEFNNSMTAPEMISGPAPEYTPEAIDREIEGSMSVRCVVAVSGTVRSCRVIKSLQFMDAAVISALERRKYKPATSQGKPLDVFYTFNLKLKLPAD